MVAHISRHHGRRQDTGAFAAPDVEGVAAAGVTLQDASIGTALAYDASATAGSNKGGSVDDSFIVSTTYIAPSATADSSPVKPSTSPTESVVSESGSMISTGTVVGACIGAFAGAALLILLGIWVYRKGTRKPREPVSAGSRNAFGEDARSRSKWESWNKLSEGKDEDVWVGKEQIREADAQTLAPMEKLMMFKKSTPSVRTMYTRKSEELPVFDLGTHPFSQYHAGLAQELASTDVSSPVHPYSRHDEPSPKSYDTGSAKDSFLTLRSAHMSGSINSTDMAIPTPPAMSTEIHHWESAEVLDFTGHRAEIVNAPENPFEHPTEKTKSASNPFAGGSITRSPTHITPPPPAITRSATIKDANNAPNPFSDDNALGHHHTQSNDSTGDRAIQSLIAALNITHQEADERLRVASMMTTTNSVYSDMSSAFPSPIPSPRR